MRAATCSPSHTYGHQGQYNYKKAIQPARLTPTWAEAIRHPPASQQLVPHRTPTYHTVARVAAYSHPLEIVPHLLLAGIYLRYELLLNEMVSRYVFPAGQVVTRELLQRHRTAAHIATMQRLRINLMHADYQGDTITVVTKIG